MHREHSVKIVRSIRPSSKYIYSISVFISFFIFTKIFKTDIEQLFHSELPNFVGMPDNQPQCDRLVHDRSTCIVSRIHALKLPYADHVLWAPVEIDLYWAYRNWHDRNPTIVENNYKIHHIGYIIVTKYLEQRSQIWHLIWMLCKRFKSFRSYRSLFKVQEICGAIRWSDVLQWNYKWCPFHTNLIANFVDRLTKALIIDKTAS